MIGPYIAPFYYYRYPQYRWACKIAGILDRTGVAGEQPVFIDAPCGDGVVSFWLARQYSNCEFVLCDISEQKISQARSSMARMNNIAIQENDIENLAVSGEKKRVWLLVNSLYLFKDARSTALNFTQKNDIGSIVAVFPHTDSKNYRCFREKNPEYINHSEMNVEETVRTFKELGYPLLHEESCTSIPFHAYPSYIRHLMGPLFNVLDRRSINGNYWLGVFVRT